MQDATFKMLKDGDFFGELAIFTNLKRTATLKSAEQSNCAYLNKQDIKLLE